MRKKKEPFKTQKDTKARNEHKILIALSMGAMSFTQIQNASGLTPAGLNSILKRMIKENKIYKKGIGKRTSYSISSGVTAKEMWYLGHILADMRENECKYYIDYSDDLQSELFDYGVPWGITSHLFLDKGIGKPLNPFQKVDIFDAEKYIFEKILSNVKKKKNFD